MYAIEVFGNSISTWHKQFQVLENLITVDPDVRNMFHENKFAIDVEASLFDTTNPYYSFLTSNIRTTIACTSSQRTDESYSPAISPLCEAWVRTYSS